MYTCDPTKGCFNCVSTQQCMSAQVYGVEWSYGYMDMPGTGVYSCRPKANPM